MLQDIQQLICKKLTIDSQVTYTKKLKVSNRMWTFCTIHIQIINNFAIWFHNQCIITTFFFNDSGKKKTCNES